MTELPGLSNEHIGDRMLDEKKISDMPGSLEYFLPIGSLLSQTMSPLSIVTSAYRGIISFNSCVMEMSLLLHVRAILENEKSGENFIWPAVKNDTLIKDSCPHNNFTRPHHKKKFLLVLDVLSRNKWVLHTQSGSLEMKSDR